MLVENDNKSKSNEFPEYIKIEQRSTSLSSRILEKTAKNKGPRYNWSPKEQGVILSSFYYGYLLTLMPGGYLAQSFSAKWIFGLGIFLSALLSLLTPTAAAMGVMPVVTVRIMQRACHR
ncbi:sialin [Caerostris extrusa]|uniref:Sialin n=1 Tax=Caerostris extrusa TaxID=172846 RepID=A0AAV4XSU0_CAEEX|nr:sialin [Caerostris extrusa]